MSQLGDPLHGHEEGSQDDGVWHKIEYWDMYVLAGPSTRAQAKRIKQAMQRMLLQVLGGEVELLGEMHVRRGSHHRVSHLRFTFGRKLKLPDSNSEKRRPPLADDRRWKSVAYSFEDGFTGDLGQACETLTPDEWEIGSGNIGKFWGPRPYAARHGMWEDKVEVRKWEREEEGDQFPLGGPGPAVADTFY
ncbi:hypothetical protein CRG98_006393 [Punica granatum]|uniref:Uncharacterized protein n=1 Tax=Punica granatum TaxID=22663 RepID=A0A2I0KXJ0_PUNGR|nr:hypothetical protein CRG98_006393 [Punica granatum]